MRIAILGGGISGLSAAWYARKKYPAAAITLLEKTDRLGGKLQTSFEGGFLFEQGPRTFMANRSPHLLALIHDLGLEAKLIFSDPAARRRFLYSRGKLRTLSSFLPMMTFSLLREPFISKGTGDDESIYDFAARRLGSRIANELIDPIALGIFAGDIHKLSIQSCFPFLTQWEKERGSIVLGALLSRFRKKRGPAGLFTLQSGMGTLIEELAQRSQAKIHLETAALEILSDGVVANETFHPADLIVSALSGSSIGRLTGLWTDFQETDLSLVHFAFEGEVLTKKGFGYLVPTRLQENLLGMVWDSAVFPQQSSSGETRVTLMMRRGCDVEEALDVMKRHLGVAARPIFSSIHLTKGAIPQFHVGYGKRLAKFEREAKEKFPSLILLGNYIRGASVDACISLAKQSF